MRHPRAFIRDAFLQRLKAPLADGTFRTAAGNRVFKSRLLPVDTNDDEELPAILIYTREDARDPKKGYGIEGSETYAHSELRIVVECVVRATRIDDQLDADDACDDIAFDVEAALEDWEIPGFEGATVRLGDSDIDVVSEGVKKPVGAIGLIWHVWYCRDWRGAPPGAPAPPRVRVVANGDAPEELADEAALADWLARP